MSSMNKPEGGKTYWRSLEEYADTPEFRQWAEAEFPAAIEPENAASRRTFLQLMGASAALAGLAACRWPEQKILPFAERPEGRVPGVPEQYATAFDRGGFATGLLVTSYDGRPIKIEGNPEHPMSRGGVHAQALASILSLYDPDRSTTPIYGKGLAGRRAGWDEFHEAFAPFFAALKVGGTGLAILSEASSSPTRARIRERLLGLCPGISWHEFEPLSRDNEREGTGRAFGAPQQPLLDLSRSRVIACFDEDLLGAHPAALAHARDFAASRRVDDGVLSRLYAVEPSFTITGGAADVRYPVRSQDVAGALIAVAAELARRGAMAPLPPSVAGAALAFEGAAQIAEDLASQGSRAVVAVGARQPAEAHLLAAMINEALGAVGTIVRYVPAADPERPTHLGALRSLAEKIEAGEVGTLVMLGGNPLYDAPADLDFSSLMSKVGTAVHVGPYRNETGEACDWHLPEAHFLESWGDARAWDGTYSVVQPLIAPLHESRSVSEILARLLGEETTAAFDLVRATADGLSRGDAETRWRRALHDGLLPEAGVSAATPNVRSSAIEALASWRVAPVAGLELVFAADGSVYDGRDANNGWLQEMPDPLTKLTWDNALLAGPSTAAALGVSHGDMVRVEAGARSLDLPVYLAPGQAADSLSVALGYGRRAAGRVGNGVGFDAYQLRTSAAPHVAAAVTVTPLGATYELATTQDHHAIDALGARERARRVPELVREASLGEFERDPDFVKHRGHQIPLFSLWEDHTYEGRAWGMAIDLNACIGCSYCTVACQAENNIPIVGKERVLDGREMHWLRVDRYYKGEPDEPEMAFLPMACQHCEMAPCEEVCPVAATVHDSEGLNVMVYNRCVGTRYCSNNCPYKVRRFNYFNYRKDLTQLESLGHNPEVTVRSRGVMEKCTYCTQRIERAKIEARNEGRPVADGEITPACAQACPTEAIVFGDLNAETSRVREQHGNRRGYALLAELNVRPRTRYLGKVRNSLPTGEGHGGEEHH